MDKRLMAVLSIFILSIAVIPMFQAADTSTAPDMLNYSISEHTIVDAAYKGKYVGSIKSNVYHTLKCRYVKQIKSYNKIYFKTKTSARKHHYRACKVCHP